MHRALGSCALTWLLLLVLPAQNAYFPMFITEDVLNTEKDHVEGFAPEVRPQFDHLQNSKRVDRRARIWLVPIAASPAAAVHFTNCLPL